MIQKHSLPIFSIVYSELLRGNYKRASFCVYKLYLNDRKWVLLQFVNKKKTLTLTLTLIYACFRKMEILKKPCLVSLLAMFLPIFLVLLFCFERQPGFCKLSHSLNPACNQTRVVLAFFFSVKIGFQEPKLGSVANNHLSGNKMCIFQRLKGNNIREISREKKKIITL